MRKKFLIGLCAVLIASNGFADETKQPENPKQPTSPVPPAESGRNAPATNKSVGKNSGQTQKTPNAAGQNPFSTAIPFAPPALPTPPPPLPPGMTQPDANVEAAHEVANYTLTVTAAYPNGDTKKSIADTISYAQCIMYSDNSITLKLFFANGARYTYYLKNPRAKMQTSPGIFRTTYNTLVQAENTMLVDTYTSDVYSEASRENADNDQSPNLKSITIMGNDAVVVVMNFAKR